MPPQKPTKLQMFLAKITRNISFNRFNARSAEKRGGGEIVLYLLLLRLVRHRDRDSDASGCCKRKNQDKEDDA